MAQPFIDSRPCMPSASRPIVAASYSFACQTRESAVTVSTNQQPQFPILLEEVISLVSPTCPAETSKADVEMTISTNLAFSVLLTRTVEGLMKIEKEDICSPRSNRRQPRHYIIPSCDTARPDPSPGTLTLFDLTADSYKL